MNPVRSKHLKKSVDSQIEDRTSSGMNRLSDLVKRHGFKVYPLLFAFFPLLSFYGANSSEIQSGGFNLATFILFNLVVLAVLWPLALLVMRSLRKASILAVVILAIFFSFGRFHDHLQDFVINTPITPLGPTKILLLASGLILLLAWFGIRRLSPKGTDVTNLTLTIVGAYLFISTLLSVALPQLTADQKASKASDSPQASLGSNIEEENLPDIYYIVLDGYARSDILKANFNYDNSEFLNSLKGRKFYIADKANSNYTHTHFSVSSTFNMKYLNYLTKQMGEESTDRSPLRELVQKNEAAKIFKSMGYKYVVIGSQWAWGESSPIADIVVKTKKQEDTKILNITLDEFALVYLQTTALKPWISSSLREGFVAKILGAFDRTEEVSNIDGPTFTFTHILSPHPPYLFNKGGIIKQTKLEILNHGFSDRKKYAEQTEYVNKRTLEMIDTILNNSDKPPIIILASDHGPASSLGQSDFNQTDPAKFDREGIKERHGILNTYYFPDRNYSKLYPDITPVNSFRLILDQYFGQKNQLLPDRSYFSNNKANEYRLFDVTDLIKN
ncbi:MAG: hypothetical protein WD885_02345 [Candidatus Saccharimonadales bacterium]